MKEKIDYLTGLKGIFCMIIVLFHTWDMEAIGEYIIFPYIANYGGFLGNYFFFIVSGVVISYNYKERIRYNNINFKNYILKRIIRLYPLYFLSNMCAFIRSIYLYGTEIFNVKDFLFIFSMLAGGSLINANPYNSVCWFACVLLFCYILYFVITRIFKEDKIYYVIILGTIIWGIILLNQDWNFPYFYIHTGEAITNFFLGCIIYEIMFREENSYKVYFFISVILVLFGWGTRNYLLNGILDVRMIISFIICPIIIYISNTQKICRIILDNCCLRYLGKISTSIFFWHLFLSKIFFPLFEYKGMYKDIIEYLVYIIVLLLWSTISYQIIEKKLGKFLNNNLCR